LEAVAAPVLDQHELEQHMPMLKTLLQQVISLKDCIAQGIMDWKQVVVGTTSFLHIFLADDQPPV